MADRDDKAGLLARFVRGLNAAGSIWIILLMLLINADIFGRFALNAPIAGTAEMVSFSIVGIVFLQLAHTLRSGAMTRSDVLVGWLACRAPRLRNALECLFHLTGAVLLAIVAVKLYPWVAKAWTDPARYFMGNPGFFTVPKWPLYVLVEIGVIATALQFVASAWASLRRGGTTG